VVGASAVRLICLPCSRGGWNGWID
jgi:hypothetical protein